MNLRYVHNAEVSKLALNRESMIGLCWYDAPSGLIYSSFPDLEALVFSMLHLGPSKLVLCTSQFVSVGAVIKTSRLAGTSGNFTVKPPAESSALGQVIQNPIKPSINYLQQGRFHHFQCFSVCLEPGRPNVDTVSRA